MQVDDEEAARGADAFGLFADVGDDAACLGGDFFELGGDVRFVGVVFQAVGVLFEGFDGVKAAAQHFAQGGVEVAGDVARRCLVGVGGVAVVEVGEVVTGGGE